MLGTQMCEKNGNFGWVFRTNPIVQWWFKVLAIGVFLGILIVCGIDSVDFSVANLQRDFAVLKSNISFANDSLLPHSANVNLTQTVVDLAPKLGLSETSENNNKDSTFTNVNLTQTIVDLPENQTEFSNNPAEFAANLSQPLEKLGPEMALNEAELTENQSTILNRSDGVSVGTLSWISADLEANYASMLFDRWMAPGGEPCRESKTADIEIKGVDVSNGIELTTGEIHEFVFQAVDESGKPYCLGGDYFETDLTGEKWKSRPPIKDFGNGTYKFSIQVHPDFAGDYNLTIILLYRHYEGLKISPQKLVVDKVLRVVPVKFKTSSAELPGLQHCRKNDFIRDVWSGRWTRHAKNDGCTISNDGRYRCQSPDFPCERPWCDGPLGSLESNGWVYSTHCSFKLYSSDEAWNCLSGRWIFWWGDSNHVDTIRNILNFVLGLTDVKAVPRRYDANITNPRDPSQVIRFTSVFNGHYNESANYLGLNSLSNPEYRELLKRYFSGDSVPDTIIMNSGLHDGFFWPNLRAFMGGAEYATSFWAGIIEGVKKRGLRPPEVIYRTTVTTGGYARALAFNPQKMEAYNGVVLDKLKAKGILNRVIDDFDMTYPWHYDNRCSDGVHYGRPPLKYRWRDGQIGHQYFVDLMLCHVIINTLCAS